MSDFLQVVADAHAQAAYQDLATETLLSGRSRAF